MHCFSPTRANIINTLWKHCEALQRLEPLSRKNISIFESPFEIRVFEVSWYNGVDENNLKCLENPRLFTRTPWFICSCQQCCVEISFRRNFLNLNWPRRKASFSPRQGIWIFERFLRHVWIFSGEKKTHIAYSIIPVSAGSILSCNIVAVRLVHTVWIAMNDRFGEGKWPVVASYDNIYALSHTLYVRPKECRGNISILSLSLPPFPSLYIKIIVYFPSSIPIYY